MENNYFGDDFDFPEGANLVGGMLVALAGL